MFNVERLHEILTETTMIFRKGEAVVRQDNVAYLMPHEDVLVGLEKIDLHFVFVGVDKAKAEERRDEIIDILNNYPDPEQLGSGPSYMSVGATVGSQDTAFQLFALGQVLNLWKVIIPETLGANPEQARKMAGMGYIMITGYKQEEKANG